MMVVVGGDGAVNCHSFAPPPPLSLVSSRAVFLLKLADFRNFGKEITRQDPFNTSELLELFFLACES